MPPSKKPATNRATRSKAEVEEQMESVASSHSGADALDPKAAGIAKRNAENTRKTVKGMSIEAVVKDIGTLGLDVGKAFSDISQKLQTKLEELATVQEAVNLEKAELETLHGKDIVASAITNLITDFNEKKTKLTDEFAQAKAKFAEEKANLEKAAKEFAAELKKNREREQQDWDYNTSRARKAEQDAFQEKLREQQRASENMQETLNKGWAQREADLTAREAELKDLRAQVAGHAESIKKEVASGVAAATASMKKDHENALNVARITAESDKRALTQEVQAQAKTIAHLQQQVDDLREELAAKSEQVVTIAAQAVQSASGRAALEAVKEVSREGGSAKTK